MSGPSLPTVILSAVVPGGVVAALPLPPGAPEWVQYVAVFAGICAGPALTFFANKVAPRYLAGKAAKKASLALAKERRAKQLRADNDASNDGIADKLDDEADALRAEQAELEALSGPREMPDDADARRARRAVGDQIDK